MNKTGRNDPCPCGSGLKYKKCCMERHAATERDPQSRVPEVATLPTVSLDGSLKLIAAANALLGTLFSHADTHYGHDCVMETWFTFTFGADLPMDPDEFAEAESLFPYWFFHDWREFDPGLLPNSTMQPPESVAMHYLQTKGRSISAFERRMIEAVKQSHYSFHQVVEHHAGQQITFVDLLTTTQNTVLALQDFDDARPGDIFYMRFVTVDGHTIPYGHGPLIIDEHYLPQIEQLRLELGRFSPDSAPASGTPPALDPQILRDDESALRSLYFSIRREEDALQGIVWNDLDDAYEPVELTRLMYHLKCSTSEALDALKGLSGFDAFDLMELGADFDEEDRLLSVHVPWFKHEDPDNPSWDSETLGDFFIEGQTLFVTVATGDTTQAACDEVATRLGDRAELLSHEQFDVNDWLEEMDFVDDDDDDGDGDEVDGEDGDDMFQASTDGLLTDDGSNQKELDRLIDTHWEQWMDTRLAELGGVTPRKAAQTEQGRETLKSLLDDFEQQLNTYGTRHAPDWIGETLQILRHKLGLKD